MLGGFGVDINKYWVSLGARCLRTHLPVQETWDRPLGQEDPLEKKWQGVLVFLPGKSHGQRSLWGIIHGVTKESDTTQQPNNNSIVGLKCVGFRHTAR